jgi:DNA-binding GntR family transcriptional regulator
MSAHQESPGAATAVSPVSARRSSAASAPAARKDSLPAAEAGARTEHGTRAYERLRELIVWGRLAPGSRIIERDISERLGVSRTPVRAAFQRLQQEGYVILSDPDKDQRLTVAPLTQDDARELFSIVGQVEGLAARGASELPPPRRTALVRLMRASNKALRDAARERRPDPLQLFDADAEFHRAYVEAGSGPRLLALYNAIKPQAERYLRLYVSALLDEIATSVEEHDLITQRIEEGKPAAAEQAVDTNWRNAGLRLQQVIGTFGERGSW